MVRVLLEEIESQGERTSKRPQLVLPTELVRRGSS
ncbi:hypothetical protein SBI_04583 [Streptomyces bingchenggensis BCW-1]|uniref:Uncharacterized protein n=2 Tax=Streptomyces TaxID=1883 RepID=D7BXD0_STRBB|nr:hypothetical protein SBI_04583 [Streptomyces bingchenggensis BCW-1]